MLIQLEFIQTSFISTSHSLKEDFIANDHACSAFIVQHDDVTPKVIHLFVEQKSLL